MCVIVYSALNSINIHLEVILNASVFVCRSGWIVIDKLTRIKIHAADSRSLRGLAMLR